ncbi:hypothetical protein CLAIMM_14082, partial [Cladophialophora immunda]
MASKGKGVSQRERAELSSQSITVNPQGAQESNDDNHKNTRSAGKKGPALRRSKRVTDDQIKLCEDILAQKAAEDVLGVEKGKDSDAAYQARVLKEFIRRGSMIHPKFCGADNAWDAWERLKKTAALYIDSLDIEAMQDWDGIRDQSLTLINGHWVKKGHRTEEIKTLYDTIYARASGPLKSFFKDENKEISLNQLDKFNSEITSINLKLELPNTKDGTIDYKTLYDHVTSINDMASAVNQDPDDHIARMNFKNALEGLRNVIRHNRYPDSFLPEFVVSAPTVQHHDVELTDAPAIPPNVGTPKVVITNTPASLPQQTIDVSGLQQYIDSQ